MQHERPESGVEPVRRWIDRIAVGAGRPAGSVTVVGATKYLDVPKISQLVDAGLRDLGENRAETLDARRTAVAEALPGAAADLRWHFMGRLQSRRVAQLIGKVDVIHTLASLSAVRRLAACAEEGLALPHLLVQVNVDGDAAKDGLEPAQLDAFLEALPPAVRIDGLMTMPAAIAEPGDSRAAFATLRTLAETMREQWEGRHDVRWLSMGTSQDADVAVEEGATHVRLGRILYGQRE